MGQIPLFDAHCDTLLHMYNTGEGLLQNQAQVDLERSAFFAPYAQFFAIFQDGGKPGPALWDQFCAMADLFECEVRRSSEQVCHCRTARDAQCAAQQGKAAAFLSVEGAELLECSVERLEHAHRIGVRAVTLTWNHANALSGSHCDEPQRGLSARGVEFVAAMRRLGMLIDVSHLSDAGFWDVIDCSPGPLIATHSNARGIQFHTRNLTDNQITAIINNRGVIGLNLYTPFVGDEGCGVDRLAAHLEHIWQLGGEDAVALGGDWDGAAGRMPRGFRDIRDWCVLFDALLARNYPESLLKNLFYNNMLRIVSEVCST